MKTQDMSSPIFSGLLYTVILVLIGSLITAILLRFTNIRETSLPYFTYSINTIALLIGGFISGKRGGHKGWYFGGVTGLLYFILIALIGFLAFDVGFKLSILYFLFGSFLIGAIGGVIGVNTVKR